MAHWQHLFGFYCIPLTSHFFRSRYWNYLLEDGKNVVLVGDLMEDHRKGGVCDQARRRDEVHRAGGAVAVPNGASTRRPQSAGQAESGGVIVEDGFRAHSKRRRHRNSRPAVTGRVGMHVYESYKERGGLTF